MFFLLQAKVLPFVQHKTEHLFPGDQGESLDDVVL